MPSSCEDCPANHPLDRLPAVVGALSILILPLWLDFQSAAHVFRTVLLEDGSPGQGCAPLQGGGGSIPSCGSPCNRIVIYQNTQSEYSFWCPVNHGWVNRDEKWIKTQETWRCPGGEHFLCTYQQLTSDCIPPAEWSGCAADTCSP